MNYVKIFAGCYGIAKMTLYEQVLAQQDAGEYGNNVLLMRRRNQILERQCQKVHMVFPNTCKMNFVRIENIYNMRLFGVYGPYEDWSSCFISNICCKTIFNVPLSMRQNCIFSYIYVEDLVDIILLFLRASHLNLRIIILFQKKKQN